MVHHAFGVPNGVIVNFPDNSGTNPGWDYRSWSTDTESPGLLSAYLCMDPYFFTFVLHFHLLDVPNMHDVQRCTSYFKYRNTSWDSKFY